MRLNTFISGLVLGVIFPALAYLLTQYTSIGTSINAKPLTFYVLAALVNLIAIRFLYRSGNDATAKGILFSTFFGVILLIFVQGFRL